MGFELGINSSGLPTKGTYSNGNENSIPKVSPVFGFLVKRSNPGHIFMSLGVQYNQSGENNSFNKNGFDVLNNQSYSINVIEHLKFSKISVPILIGYDFKIRSLKSSIFLGYKQVYFIYGSYYYKHTLIQDINGFEIVKKINPFSKTNLDVSAQQRTWQLYSGFDINFKGSFSLSITFSPSMEIIYFRERPPIGAIWDDPSFNHRYTRSDLSVMIMYSIR